MEEWKYIDDSKKYEISNRGIIRNVKTGKIIKTYINRDGYEQVTLRRNHKYYVITVHRLVAKAFITDDLEYIDILHKDKNKLNNHVDNLIIRERDYPHDRKRVRVIETGEIFNSINECSIALGISRSTISKCCNYNFCNNKSGYNFELID